MTSQFKISNQYDNNGLPFTFIIHLGVLFVNGRSLVPKPAASNKALK